MLRFRSYKSDILKRSSYRYGILFLVIMLFCTFPEVSAQVNQADASGLNLVRETIWLSTDRPIYIAGENIIVSATVMELDNYQVSTLSTIMYLELCNSEGKELYKGKFKLTDGRVTVVIESPDNLKNNNYYIRAYTRWMRNFSSDFYSIFPVKIVNSLPDNQAVTSDQQRFVDIDFKPEWGMLISGVSNSTSIFISDEFGEGFAATGYLVGNASDTISKIESNLTGWALLDWVPESGTEYNVLLQDDSLYTKRIEIPEIISDYPNIEISSDRRNLIITFSPGSNSNSDEIRLLVHGMYTLYWSGSNAPGSTGKVSFIVPNNLLPEGVFQFTLFDSADIPLAKRLYSLASPANDIGLEIAISDEAPGLNSEIKLELNYNSVGVSNDLGSLYRVVSLDDQSGFDQIFTPGMPGWEITGKIPVDDTSFSSWLIGNSYDDNIALNIIHELNTESEGLKYSSSDSPDIRFQKLKYLPETRGITLSGLVTNQESNLPEKNVNIALSLIESNDFYSAKTNERGEFIFVFPERTGQEEIVVSIIENQDLALNVQVDDGFDKAEFNLPEKPFVLTKAEREFLEKVNVNNQLNKIYNGERVNNRDVSLTELTDSDSLDFYGEPDRKVAMARYIDLLNLREIIYEILPGVYTRLDGEDYVIYIIGEYPFIPNYKTLVLVDGIPFREFNSLLELMPSIFRSVEVKYSTYFHGNNAFAGIVNFKSIDNDLGGLKMPEGSRLINYSFVNDFDILDFEPELVDKDDILISNTLLFDRIEIGEFNSLEIRTGYTPGIYKLRIFGFDSSGKWINLIRSISIGGFDN